MGHSAVNFVLSSQYFAVTPDWSKQTITLAPDPAQWFCLGGRHDLTGVSGWGGIESVLRDANIDIILLLPPLQIEPLQPQPDGPDSQRAELDYEVDRRILPSGEISLSEVQIDFFDNSTQPTCSPGGLCASGI